MDRLALFEVARAKVQALHVKHPDVRTLESIIRQIDYLIGLEAGLSNDRSRLNEIVLGVQAAREIESIDSNLAEMLYVVNEQSRQM